MSAKVGIYSLIFSSLFQPFVVLLHYIPIEVGKFQDVIFDFEKK